MKKLTFLLTLTMVMGGVIAAADVVAGDVHAQAGLGVIQQLRRLLLRYR